MDPQVVPPPSGDGLYDLEDIPQPIMTTSSPESSSPSSAPTVARPSTPQHAEPPATEGGEAKSTAAADSTPKAPAKKKKKRKRRRFDAPAWFVSVLVHAVILLTLAAYTFTTDAGKQLVANINSALIPGPQPGEEEVTPIYADPSTQKSNEAVGVENAETVGGSSGIGGGPPTATPVVSGAASGVNEKSSLPGMKVVANVSGLSLVPAAPGLDLGGSGLIAGDVTFEAGDVGESLDQIAREILRHLSQHKLTVVWLFDESESMKDDQRAIKDKFDRIVSELKAHSDSERATAEAAAPKKKDQQKYAEPLTHAIVSYGADIHYQLEKPTENIQLIGKAIDKLKIDSSGTENTLHAINEVIDHYKSLIKSDKKLLIVLVTDESGDDGDFVEEAHQAVVNKGVPIYVIGRQSLFGYSRAHLRYIDPVTKDEYWPAIHRGPETADVELLQWDGLHERWDELPSGFAPYELSRLTKDSGGIFFLLPSEENMRVHQREKNYKIADLKEYAPELMSRNAYAAERNKSEFRRTLHEIIELTRNAEYRREFPIDHNELASAITEASELATARLQTLLSIQKRLEALKPLREREPEKRWQAHYDLILAQIVAYQIKSYEYRACLAEMARTMPVPTPPLGPEQSMVWVINHATKPMAPKEQTAEKYKEATRLLQEVIAKHPKTPWADLAQDEITRGFSCVRNEWRRSASYGERAKLVPKY